MAHGAHLAQGATRFCDVCATLGCYCGVVPSGDAQPQEVETAVESLDLLADEHKKVVEKIRENTLGLMLYGSRARGDFRPESDYDLLRYSRIPSPTFHVGRVSVSTYSPDQLRSADRTLFGSHLARDGKIILDPSGGLAEIISDLKPANPSDLLATVRRYSVILNTSPEDKLAHVSGLVRLARYLTRTAIYAKAMASGSPCFSVRELAARFDDPALASLLASDPSVTGAPTLSTLSELVDRLIAVIGPLPESDAESIEALAVDAWATDRNLAALAVRAASEDSSTLDYSDLPKVLL